MKGKDKYSINEEPCTPLMHVDAALPRVAALLN
jgi:hypothetical protein